MTIVTYKTKILMQEEMEILLANQRSIDWSRQDYPEFNKPFQTLTRLVFRPLAFEVPDWVKFRATGTMTVSVTGRRRDGKIITKEKHCVANSFSTRIPAKASKFRPEEYADRFRDEIYREMARDKDKILPGSDYFYIPFVPFLPMGKVAGSEDLAVMFRYVKLAFVITGKPDE